MVGALSIVRFRTPIKEPEELVYLFLAIGVGLGYAAGHTWLTTFVTLLILVTIYYWSFNKKQSINEYNLIISWNNQKISLEHLPPQISPIPNVESAPARFDLYELRTEVDPVGHKLGSYHYSVSQKMNPLQSWGIQNPVLRPIAHLKIAFRSNHGHSYTCVYRFRAHGSVVS